MLQSERIQDKGKAILKFGEDTKRNIEKLLDDNTTDTEIATAILNIEQECLKFFRYRRSLLLDTRSLQLTIRNPGQTQVNTGQKSKGVVTEYGSASSYIMNVTYYSEPNENRIFQRYQPEAKVDDTAVFSKLYSVVLEKANTCHELPVGCTGWSAGALSPFKYSNTNYSAYYADNFMYRNDYLDRSEMQSDDRRLISLDVREINTGFTEEYGFPSTFCRCTFEIMEDEGNPRIVMSAFIHVPIGLNIDLIAKFENSVWLPGYYVNGFELSSSRLLYGQAESYVITFIGNRKPDMGLETIFLYLDAAGNRHSVSICAVAVKFKCTGPIDLTETSVSRYRQGAIIKDKSGAFSVFICRLAEDIYWVSYRSSLMTPSVSDSPIHVIRTPYCFSARFR